MPDFRNTIIAIALSQLGVTEHPLGSNRGKEVDAYCERAGVPLGSYWCVAFVYWCIDEAARKLSIPNPVFRTGSSSQMYHWARSHGRLTDNPRGGDIGLVRGGETGWHHGVLVKGRIGNLIRTVEGNTNLDGSSNGIGVFLRWRRKSTMDFVSVAKL